VWIPVVNDTINAGARPLEEPLVETIIQTIPERLLTGIEFVWLRDFPTSVSDEDIVAVFRANAAPENHLAALVRTDQTMVLEVYMDQVESGLTDDWLHHEWGIESANLQLTTAEKLQIAVFTLLTHYGLQQGMITEAKCMIRKIGRVIFRAAVRRVIADLKQQYPHMRSDETTTSGNSTLPPISHEDIARVNYDKLFSQLLDVNYSGPAQSEAESVNDSDEDRDHSSL